MKLVKTNIPGLLKDMQTNAILNKDVGEYLTIKAARTRRRQEAGELDSLRREVKELKDLIKALGAKLNV